VGSSSLAWVCSHQVEFGAILGTDLVRDRDGQWYVLEDNLRCPSGVSYVLENRRVMKSTFPQVFGAMEIQPVDDYLAIARNPAESSASQFIRPYCSSSDARVYNSAYFEHSFLAQQMG